MNLTRGVIPLQPHTSETIALFLRNGFALDGEMFTIGGNKVRILATNGDKPNQVIGYVARQGKPDCLHRWDIRGFSYATERDTASYNLVANYSNSIDWHKPIMTRGQYAFRLLGHDRLGERRHYGFITVNRKEEFHCWYDDGRCVRGKDGLKDLINP